jgi:hypothetical protein
VVIQIENQAVLDSIMEQEFQILPAVVEVLGPVYKL